ncbi:MULTISPECIES: PucR family transcriptional regulator [unclassified Streptomyces]|uniref:PucR family transcriptional regulator n=1 Tax=unclassified Streptomyces TaxID=2593676 RepID=UPI001371BBBB|nr:MULTISPECIES: PucR family transcriptional regulator [unclassified Streptomyces]NDZ98592.1 PucR family transcriptional regulator [Streptomyces sp. SID10116]MYY80034.1 PucR family transcriptional regulator [Streptomyces sp. SID335]MYZ15059.1 PucR family transcriptional regulator [Streptomyces sp. SID337]NDZ90771.1 PucR family transcriptional regulator [Streptomyces sp. SID10115]NEB45113.1 PucR family transcriptional regulator [Streptomyces sp. SID339]
MGSLFAELARQASVNARREVETYAREIAEFGFLDTNSRARAETLEYALWLRRRTVALSPDNSELSDDDLGYIAAIGESRAEAGMTLDARQRVLRLHTSLMLREINEATEAQRGVGGGVGELMRMMHWFAPQGERGIRAYSQGFVTALRHRLPYVEQAALLARSLLKGDPISTGLASALGMELPERCAVVVIRVPDRPADDRDLESEIEALVKTHHAPITWGPGEGRGGGELIALIPLIPLISATPPDSPGSRTADDPLPDRVSDLVRDFAQALGRPCAVGAATSSLSEVADALDLARRVSRAAPLRRASSRLRPYTMSDLFVELAVADAPFVDAWLQAVGRSLQSGPDLLVTLDAYYRHDMHRGATAAALVVHPRTLDYRLRRVRELTGIDPGSTRGVRIFSSVVTRYLSGTWH